jgi:hypothetical protein
MSAADQPDPAEIRIMSDLIAELEKVRRSLNFIDPGLEPDRARSLLRHRREIEHKLKENRERGEAFRQREQNQPR